MPEVIGIYEEPPPAGCTGINSLRVAPIGAVPLLGRATRLRDRIYRAAGSLLE